MRDTSKWDLSHSENLVIASLDVTNESSVEMLVQQIISQEGM